MLNCFDQALKIGIAVSTIEVIQFWRLGIAYDSGTRFSKCRRAGQNIY